MNKQEIAKPFLKKIGKFQAKPAQKIDALK
jgi:hypothetical protein